MTPSTQPAVAHDEAAGEVAGQAAGQAVEQAAKEAAGEVAGQAAGDAAEEEAWELRTPAEISVDGLQMLSNILARMQNADPAESPTAPWR